MKKLVSLLLALMLVVSCLAGITFAADAEAKWTDGTTTKEGTLDEMAKLASKDGGTLTLLKDVHCAKTSGYAVNSASSFVFDLNGKTLTSDCGGVSITESKTGKAGTAEIKNGTIISKSFAITCYKGGLHVDGVTAYVPEKQAMLFMVTEGTWNGQHLIENSTIVSDRWGAMSFNQSEKDQSAAVVTFKNSTIANTANSSAVVRQKGAGTPTVQFGEGMKIYAKGASAIDGNLIRKGEALTKVEGQSLEFNGNTYEGLTLWTTPEKGTVDLSVSAPAAPATPATPATPAAPAETTTPAATSNAKNADKAKASWTDGKTAKEGSFKEMMAEASKNGGMVTMKEDAQTTGDANYAFVQNKAFILDMNGCTLTTSKGGINVQSKAEAVFVIKNGTIISNGQANLNVRGAGMQVQNMTLFSATNQNINYYEVEDTYNKDSIIENSTLVSAIWYCVSYNDTGANQEKASITIKNSTLACVKAAGCAPLGLQTKPEGSKATFVLGEGVKLMSYGKAAKANAVQLLGEAVGQTATGTAEVTVAGETYSMMNAWETPATATVDLAAAIPGNTAAHTVVIPTAPATPAPSTPSTPSTSTPSTSTPTTPAQSQYEVGGNIDNAVQPGAVTGTVTNVSGGMSEGIVIAIIAAVAVVAVVGIVAVVVLKKKKQ